MELDPGLLAVFGSATRLRTLAVLANTERPLTRYAIARTLGVVPAKVYNEVARLERAGVVTERLAPGGRRGYALSDSDLRIILRRRVRISDAQDLFEEVNRVTPRAMKAQADVQDFDVKKYRQNPTSVPNPDEFVRPPTKDRELVRAGLRPSRRLRSRS